MIHSVTSSSLALLMDTSSLDEVVVLAASVAVASEAAGLLPADAPWFCRCCCCQARSDSDGLDEDGGGGESGRKLCCRAAPGGGAGRVNAPQLILSGVSGAGEGVAAGLPAMEPTWDCE